MSLRRPLAAAAVALIAVASWAGGLGVAVAAPTATNAPATSDVAVSVPAPTPAPPMSYPPIPPQAPPAASAGTGATGGAAGGTGAQAGGAGAPATEPAAPAPAACVPKEPVVPTAPVTGGGDASVDKEVYSAGDTVTAIASGFGAEEQVQLVFFGEPVLIGTFAADATGAVVAQFAVSAETLAGSHTVQFTGWCGSTSTAQLLVGIANAAGATGVQGVPVWLWWVGGGLGLIVLAIGTWWAVRVMRAPASTEAVLA